MTRKDYVALAAALVEAKRTAEYGATRWGTEAAQAFVATHAVYVREISRALAADNPRFDRERFETAAGVER